MAVKQTAGRDQLGRLAPQFAALNDDVLFGQVWSREDELPPATVPSSPSPRFSPPASSPSWRRTWASAGRTASPRLR